MIELKNETNNEDFINNNIIFFGPKSFSKSKTIIKHYDEFITYE